MLKKFSTLYGLSSSGKIKQWDIRVESDSNDVPVIIISNGYIDGKKKDSVKKVSSGKNVGRANETTPFEQACSEAQSKWQKQIDKGYCEDKDRVDVPVLPMLAQKYKERKHYIKWSCYI